MKKKSTLSEKDKKSWEEESSYKSRDKIMKKAKPLHKHLYKNLHKKDTSGDVNEGKTFKQFMGDI